MRSHLPSILPLLAMMACASSDPVSVSASQVNPVIEQRIVERVEEGRSQGSPDIRDMPLKAPELPSKRELAAERAALVTEGQNLAGEINAMNHPDTAELTAKAEALKASIKQDRAAIEAEKIVTERVLRGESLPKK